MLCFCQNLAVGFSIVKKLFQTGLVHENASSCSLVKSNVSAWWVVLVGDVCLFFGLHNMKPEALSLRVLRCWFLALTAFPSCLIYPQFSKAFTLQPRLSWLAASPWMLQQGNTCLTELPGVLENTAHLKPHLDQNWAWHPWPWLEPLFQKRIFQEKMGHTWGKRGRGKEGEKEEGRRKRKRRRKDDSVLKERFKIYKDYCFEVLPATTFAVSQLSPF